MVEVSETLREYMSRIGKKGAASAKKKIPHKDRVRWGKMSGRKKSKEIEELMKKEGISRHAAWFRLHRATGKPVGRPRKNRDVKK